MSQKIQEIKEKLKKLIAKEASLRDIGNQAEADSFAARIQELMLEYQINLEDLESNSPHGAFLIDWGGLTRPHESDWVLQLIHACCPACFCTLIAKNGTQLVWVFGEGTNVEMLEYMILQLIPKIRELARRSFAAYQGLDKRNTYLRSFYKGAATSIHIKLRKDQQVQAQTYGIVLRANARTESFMQKWMEDMGIKVKSKNSSSSSSFAGFNAGREAGDSVAINKGIGQRGPTKQLN